MTAKFLILWEFAVAPDKQRVFEEIYGAEGDWAKLFGQAEGYLGTELQRDRENPCRYLTLDYWKNRAAFESFRRKFQAEYEALDKRCDGLAESEKRIGEFEGV